MTSPIMYDTPRVAPKWAFERNTHEAVAMAIHAIADDERTPDAIWSDPSFDEFDRVIKAVEAYIAADLFAAEPDGRYSWGMETITIVDSPTKRIQTLVAEQGAETVAGYVTEWCNASSVDIAADGRIWIAQPQRGHWLDGDRLDEFWLWLQRL